MAAILHIIHSMFDAWSQARADDGDVMTDEQHFAYVVVLSHM